jgi:hypothetical protein
MSGLKDEREYLTREAASARTAVSKAMDDLCHSAAEATNPRRWAREHPWMTIGLGGVGAFTAVKFVGGRKRRRRESSEQPKRGATLPSWPKLLLHEIFSVVRPTIASVVMAAIHSRTSSSADARNNGHHSKVR